MSSLVCFGALLLVFLPLMHAVAARRHRAHRCLGARDRPVPPCARRALHLRRARRLRARRRVAHRFGRGVRDLARGPRPRPHAPADRRRRTRRGQEGAATRPSGAAARPVRGSAAGAGRGGRRARRLFRPDARPPRAPPARSSSKSRRPRSTPSSAAEPASPYTSTPTRCRRRRSRTGRRVLVAPLSCSSSSETQPSGSPDAFTRDDGAECGVDQIDGVRTEVGQRAALEPPRRRERTAVQQRARHPCRRGRRAGCPIVLALGDEVLHRRGVAQRQQQHGAHAGGVDRGDESFGRRQVERDGLFEQQRLAGLRPRRSPSRPARSAARRTQRRRRVEHRSYVADRACALLRRAASSAASGRRAHTPTNSVSGWFARTGPCTMFAHGPAPTSPTLYGFAHLRHHAHGYGGT